jgi:hypothetical protein
MSKGKVSIKISRDLYEEVKRRIGLSQDEFRTVEDYVEFILREVLKEEEKEHEQPYTPEEEEKIKERLRSLGYL